MSSFYLATLYSMLYRKILSSYPIQYQDLRKADFSRRKSKLVKQLPRQEFMLNLINLGLTQKGSASNKCGISIC